MTEIPEGEEELQLAKRILDLAKITEDNSNSIQNLNNVLLEIRSEQEKLIKHIEEWDIRLESKISEITDQLNETHHNYSDETKRIEKKFDELNLELDPKIQEISEKASNNLAEISEKIIVLKEDLANTLETKIGEKEQELITTFNEKYIEIQNNYDKEISNISNDLNMISETLQMLVESVQNINHVNEDHNEVLDSYQSAFLDLKTKIKEIINITKKDQKELFDSFSTILESNSEDIRTEIAVTTQTLLDNDKSIIEKSKDLFTQKKLGEEPLPANPPGPDPQNAPRDISWIRRLVK